MNHNQIDDSHCIFHDGGTVVSLANDRVGGEGLKWKIDIFGYSRSVLYPIGIKLAEVAVVASKEVTVTAYCKKDKATTVGAQLVCYAGQLLGASPTEDVKANDTDWEQLSLTFTPTEAGVIEIEGQAYWISELYGTPTAYADSPDEAGVNTQVTCNAHGLSEGDTIIIVRTTNGQYDGTWVVEHVATNTFDIVKVYVSNPAAKGTWQRSAPVYFADVDVTQAA
jgi:hypothetical protein